jgi:hypothetical protein
LQSNFGGVFATKGVTTDNYEHFLQQLLRMGKDAIGGLPGFQDDT